MTKTESLDTNAVLRLLLNDVPQQHRAVMALLCDGSERVRYHIDDLVVAETAYVLENLYELDRGTISDLLNVLFKEPTVVCSEELFLQALPFWVAHPKLSFYDGYLVWNATLAGRTPLWTFDRKLAGQSEAAQLIAASE